jgi:hypothetical protein
MASWIATGHVSTAVFADASPLNWYAEATTEVKSSELEATMEGFCETRSIGVIER